MKKLLYLVLPAAVFFAASCSGSNEVSPVDDAELAFENGDYPEAQEICDSLVLSPESADLSIDRLCRLSLLLIRLSENYGNEESNIALAARSLQIADERYADSVDIFAESLPVEDRGRLSLLRAISEAHTNPAISDTLDYEE